MRCRGAEEGVEPPRALDPHTPRIVAFTRATKLENGDHDLDDTFKASTTSSILICRVYSLPIFILELYVLEFRNAASSLTGLRARLPLENRDAAFLFAIFLLEQLSSLSRRFFCIKKKKKEKKRNVCKKIR